MKRWLLGGAIFFIVVITLAAAVIWSRAPEALRLKLERVVTESCETCELKIGGLELGFGDFAFTDVQFKSGLEGAFQTYVRIPKLRGHLSLSSLLHHRVVLHNLVLVEPEVVLTDGEKKSPSKKEEDEASESKSEWTYLLRDAVVENGKFVYTRNLKGTSATLHIHDIHASIDEVGTTERTHDRISTMLAHFQIEKSGEIELRLGVPFFVKPLQIDLKLEVKDENLADLNPFFEPNAGVDLKGIVQKGEAESTVRDRHIKSKVMVIYDGFDLVLKSTYDRSGFVSFWTNLGADIVMSKDNRNAPPAKQVSTVERDRKPDESIVSFILQSLKEAAIQVTRN